MSGLPDTPRRFVAGAKCPQCRALDKLVMFRREGVQYRECVSCGYRDDMVFEPAFLELETRVNRAGSTESVVRLVDPD